MKRIKTIVTDVLPCWYELSWREILPPAIILRIHKDFIREIIAKKIDFENAPIVWGFKIEFGFEKFVGDFEKEFGFDGALVKKGKDGEFVEFFIPIPKIKKDSGEICGDCGGSGKNETFADDECLFCSGTGKKYFYDWKSAFAISASLNIFFSLMCFWEKESSAGIPQLITIDVVTRKDLHGGSLWGQCSIPFAEYLMKISEKDGDVLLPEASEAVRAAWHHMFGLSDYEFHHDFRVNVRNGGFNIFCPGDACGLNPAQWSRIKGQGYEFSCHNVDTPAQQIALIAGLAALHDKARKEIK